MPMPQPAISRKIKPLQLIALVFFTVSGGPYGLEPLLTYGGEHSAFIILLVTPVLWDVPAIFTVLELPAVTTSGLGMRWEPGGGFTKAGGPGYTPL